MRARKGKKEGQKTLMRSSSRCPAPRPVILTLGTTDEKDKIKDNLIDIKDDGTFRLDISYFKYHRGFRMTGRKFHKLFGRPPRKGETELTQFHMDLAASIQVVTEEIVLKLAKSLREEIQQVLSNNPKESGFWIYRNNHFMGKKVRFSGWQGDKVIRLF